MLMVTGKNVLLHICKNLEHWKNCVTQFLKHVDIIRKYTILIISYVQSVENLHRSDASLGDGVKFWFSFSFSKMFLELIKENYVESNTEYTYVYKTSETKKKRFEDGGNKVFLGSLNVF